MTLEQALKGRRSVRRYNDVPVENGEILQIVEAAMWAPSACNKQAWRFLYFDKPEPIEEISKLGAAHFLAGGGYSPSHSRSI